MAIQNMERDAPWTAWSKMLQLHEEVSRKMRDTAGGTPALPYKKSVQRGRVALPKRTVAECLVALAAIFQNREADLAWPEGSIVKTVPAY
jgi:hypothetical protein